MSDVLAILLLTFLGILGITGITALLFLIGAFWVNMYEEVRRFFS